MNGKLKPRFLIVAISLTVGLLLNALIVVGSLTGSIAFSPSFFTACNYIGIAASAAMVYAFFTMVLILRKQKVVYLGALMLMLANVIILSSLLSWTQSGDSVNNTQFGDIGTYSDAGVIAVFMLSSIGSAGLTFISGMKWVRNAYYMILCAPLFVAVSFMLGAQWLGDTFLPKFLIAWMCTAICLILIGWWKAVKGAEEFDNEEDDDEEDAPN